MVQYHLIFQFFEDNRNRCCEELALDWNEDKVFKYQRLMPSPIGVYKKQTLLNKYRIVYYNNATDYYLFHNGLEWVVITMVIDINIIEFEIIKNLLK